MKATLQGFSIVIAAVPALLALGCDPGGVGDPCVPEDEYMRRFSGFAVTEVNVESASFQCETRVCLVNHFQGRVSCPYGQDYDPATGPSEHAPGLGVCSIPGADSTTEEGQVKAAVEPQLLSRAAERAVYCSCRCKGPDPNASYCKCPSGYACVELVPDYGMGGQLVGSYCVRNGTIYDEAREREGQECGPGTSDVCGDKNP
jgi:hypothetical protein